MAISDQQRRERVEGGSRRRRDLAAVGAESATPVEIARTRFKSAVEWAEAKLPDEYAPFAAASALTTKALHHRYPSPDEVRVRLKEQGRDKATLAAGAKR
jgi:hypothetical protein